MIQQTSHWQVGRSRFVGQQLGNPSWENLTAWWVAVRDSKWRDTEAIDCEAGQRRTKWSVRVHARLYIPEWHSWTNQWRQTNVSVTWSDRQTIL